MNKRVWELRSDQRKAYDALRGKSRGVVNTPTGWGKSFLLCCLCALEIVKRHRKVILCVPQRIISKGFARSRQIRLPDGSLVAWRVPRNLCDATSDKVSQLVDFIRSPARKSPADCVVLTTHLSLAYAFAKLSDEEVRSCFKRTVLVIDEAHHIQASEYGCNQLGRVIKAILDLNDPTTSLLLATAYFFRGDHLPIISEDQLNRFFRYHVPFDEYWSSLKHIKSYGYDFIAYKGTVFHELESLVKQSPEPTIIYCPPERHKLLLGKRKSGFVARVRKLCQKHFLAKLWKPTTRSSSEQKVVVDLVDTNYRAEKIQFIAAHGNAVAAILTVGMFREGADWVEAARIIDLVPSGSDQDRLQRFGRLVRDFPGKAHVSYFSFFPFVIEEDEEKRRKELSKLYAHFHASLVLQNAIAPIKMTIGKNPDSPDVGGDPGPPTGRLDLLGQLNESTQETIISQSYAELLRRHDDKSKIGGSVSPEEAKEIVVNVVRENGVEEDAEAMAKQVILVIRRKSNVQINTDDLVEAGFDKVWSTDVFDGLIAYSAGVGGPSNLAEIRRVIDKVFDLQWMDNYAKVSHLPAPPISQSSAYWWCTHNKVLHADGRLDEKKIGLLTTIAWWSWSQAFTDRWQTNYDYVSVLPQCPKATTKEYSWVRQQRRLYEEGNLEEYKVKLLEAIPWWQWATLNKNWETKFNALKRMSHAPARGSKENEWMRTQRKSYRAGKLTAERRRLLESIPWWEWGERANSRDEGLSVLEQSISDGISQGSSKTEVRNAWAKRMGIGSDQVHKYLRNADERMKTAWDRLRDDRGRR